MSLPPDIRERFNLINITICEKAFRQALRNHIPKQLCSTLACIISIDHEIRVHPTPNIKEHISNCLHKLTAFIGKKVITDESFNMVLMLFAVAISIDIGDLLDGENIINKSEDIIINTLINIYFSTLTFDKINIIKLVLKTLLREKNNYEKINFIQVDPTTFRGIVMGALKKSQSVIEISKQINLELNKIANATSQCSKKIETFKQASSKMVTAVCGIVVGAVTVATAGMPLALMVVPTTILAVKYAPKVGEIIGEIILKYDKFIIREQEKIIELKVNLNKNDNEFLADQQLLAGAKFYKINQPHPQINEGIDKLNIPSNPDKIQVAPNVNNANLRFLKEGKIKESDRKR
ncbi:RP853 family protein [Candidatus Tisiphia endosymbiont of Nemotelus uliginosus]|uniref:RP853 family protein n=1 Tax=Candidatus Tisiphia endosymbiont of Nemotelus uliginosus TaxID=3077926 RepID=UPI0035C8F968